MGKTIRALHNSQRGNRNYSSVPVPNYRLVMRLTAPDVSPFTSADTQDKTRQYRRVQQASKPSLLSNYHLASARLLWPNCANSHMKLAQGGTVVFSIHKSILINIYIMYQIWTVSAVKALPSASQALNLIKTRLRDNHDFQDGWVDTSP